MVVLGSEPLVFAPGSRFIAISITGFSCALNCGFCMGRYLRGMVPVVSPKNLFDTIRYYYRKGVRGFLISGGFDLRGALPVNAFLPWIKEAKRLFDIVVSVHPGLVDRDTALRLREAGVDIVDYELILSDRVIREVMNLHGRSSMDYIKSMENLYKYGPPFIAPHIMVGANYGFIGWEYKALEVIRDHKPYITVLLSLIPTKNTQMENVKPVQFYRFIEFVEHARNKLPAKTTLSIGCMRPQQYRKTVDHILIEKRIINRIVNPKKHYITMYNLKTINACCSIPKQYIDYFTEQS